MSPTPSSPPSRRPQIGLRMLLFLMLMFSILAATLGGLLQGGAQRQTFIIFGIAAPMGLMIVAGLLDQYQKRRQRKNK